jgi:hypothetical protein
MNVELLRKKRKKVLDCPRDIDSKDLGLKHKSTPSEFAIIKRLHFTYHVSISHFLRRNVNHFAISVCTHKQRALQKFKGDIGLWLQYFEFCAKTVQNDSPTFNL